MSKSTRRLGDKAGYSARTCPCEIPAVFCTSQRGMALKFLLVACCCVVFRVLFVVWELWLSLWLGAAVAFAFRAARAGPVVVVLSCLLALYTAVMSFEILFPFGRWVFEPDWLLDHTCCCCYVACYCQSYCLLPVWIPKAIYLPPGGGLCCAQDLDKRSLQRISRLRPLVSAAPGCHEREQSSCGPTQPCFPSSQLGVDSEDFA